MGAAARGRVEEQYQWRGIAEEWEECFRGVSCVGTGAGDTSPGATKAPAYGARGQDSEEGSRGEVLRSAAM